MVSSKVQDFKMYEGWTNWATWNVNVWLDELKLYETAKKQKSPIELQGLCEGNVKYFSDFWIEDRFGNKCLDEREWDNVDWEDLFNTYKSREPEDEDEDE